LAKRALKTAEMGTLIWYDDNENNKLFNETLSKLKPYLRKINFRGDIDINCIVALAAVSPYPYQDQAINCKYNPQDLKVRFADSITQDEWRYIHFSEVSRKLNNNEYKYIISGVSGYVMCVTGLGETVQDAREKTCRLIDKIVIPKMFYRNDIGKKFIERDQKLLKNRGYL